MAEAMAEQPAPDAAHSAPPAPERVDIVCDDGERLCGHWFVPRGAVDAHDADALPVLLSPATGVRQQFYFRFADWLAGNGHAVLVFDYRGVGQSLQGPLRASRAELADWGRHDQAAAIEWLRAHTGRPQVAIVGHSAGGQMIGLLPNHGRVARLVGISASTGWFRTMTAWHAARARLGLRILVPLGVRLTGFAPTGWLGLGEHLPAGVGLQWGRWCAAGGYATNAVRLAGVRDFHAEVRTPITVLHASDDFIANPGSVADLLRTFPAAPKAALQVRPKDHGLARLGHIDWFRSSRRAVWPLMLAALRGQGPVGHSPNGRAP